MEIIASVRSASAAMTGSTRACSSAAATAAAPGRVDSPPISRISAPGRGNAAPARPQLRHRVEPAVGKGIRRHVDDRHEQSCRAEREASAMRQLPFEGIERIIHDGFTPYLPSLPALQQTLFDHKWRPICHILRQRLGLHCVFRFVRDARYLLLRSGWLCPKLWRSSTAETCKPMPIGRISFAAFLILSIVASHSSSALADTWSEQEHHLLLRSAAARPKNSTRRCRSAAR